MDVGTSRDLRDEKVSTRDTIKFREGKFNHENRWTYEKGIKVWIYLKEKDSH